MLPEDKDIEGQTAMSRHALWRHSRDALRFRDCTTSKAHFDAIKTHAKRHGVMPISMDPDVFLTSHYRRNAKNDMDDPLLVTSLISKDSYRRHYHRVLSGRAIVYSSVCLVVSLVVGFSVLVPFIRANEHALVSWTGTALGVVVPDKPLGPHAVLIAEAKHVGKSALSAAKDWFHHRKDAANESQSQ